jgi:hypothetical protein
VSKLPPWLAAAVLAGATAAGWAAAQFLPIAQSAQLIVAGSTGPAGLTLQLRPAVAGAALAVTGVSVSLDGVEVPARALADGSWFVPLSAARSSREGRLEVFVLHDGIREVLSGRMPAPPASAAASASGALGQHKQLAWWILNSAIVLIAAIALSRRMS